MIRLGTLVGELGEMPGTHTDEAVVHLLDRARHLIGASDSLIAFGMRSATWPPDDPLLGWRSTPAVRRGPNAARDAQLLDAWYHSRPNLPLDHGLVTLACTPHAFAARQAQIAARAPHAQAAVEELFDACGIGDRILAAVPVTGHAKLLFGAYRRRGSDPFSEGDAALVEALMAAIVGPARRMALAYGVIEADRPLTPRERDVLRLLLQGLTEKESACELGLATRSLHHHVSALYAKYGVRSRAELLALFLGTRRAPR